MRRAGPWLLLALGLSYHLLALGCVLTREPEGIRPIDRLHPIGIRRDTYGEDVFCIYQAGRNFLDGRDMYSIDGATVVVPRVVPFGYHPVMGMVFSVVNMVLEPETAHRAWIIGEALLLVGLALLLARHLNLIRREAALLLGMFLLYTPLYPEYFIGQYNVLLALFFTGIVISEEGRRRLLAGSLWGLSIVIKPSLVVLGPLYVRLWRWRRLILVGLFVVLMGAPYYLSHPGSFSRSQGIFSHGMGRNAAESLGLFAFVLDIGLRGGLSLFSSEGGVGAIVLARTVTLSLALIAVTVLFCDRRPDPTLWSCILLFTYALGSHMFWEQSYVVLLPAIAILMFRYRDRRALWIWALLALPTPFALFRWLDIDYVRPYGALGRGFRWDVLAMGMIHHACKAVPLLVWWVLLLLERRSHLDWPWRR